MIRERPGLAPAALFHLIGHTVFLRLADVARGLPPYTEQVRLVDLDETPDETVVEPQPAVAAAANGANGTGEAAVAVNGQGRDDDAPAPQQDELCSWAEFLAQVPAQRKRRQQPPASLPLFEWVLAQEQEAALVRAGP